MYSFHDLESVCFSMSCFKCCFLTYIQISQEAGKAVWYSHLFQNFPQFIVIHTVKGFGIVNKAEIHSTGHIEVYLFTSMDFPGSSVIKNQPANTGDENSIPGPRRSTRGRNGNPLQYSCLENPMDRGAWLATVSVVTESWTRLKWLSKSFDSMSDSNL